MIQMGDYDYVHKTWRDSSKKKNSAQKPKVNDVKDSQTLRKDCVQTIHIYCSKVTSILYLF